MQKIRELKYYLHKWKEMNSDKEILQTVSSLILEILGDPLENNNSYFP